MRDVENVKMAGKKSIISQNVDSGAYVDSQQLFNGPELPPIRTTHSSVERDVIEPLALEKLPEY